MNPSLIPFPTSAMPRNASCSVFKPSNPPLNLNRASPTASNCLNVTSGFVSPRLHRLASEFQSLPEPIDRVKRLLDYSTRLTESPRFPKNRVPGCAAQVWLEVQMDQLGKMRFGADSDSEITKGFCYCLVYLLDGASPNEVLMVKGEDLADMNVGLPVRSRVNSWHNVLVSMQERTKSLLLLRRDQFPSLQSPVDDHVFARLETRDG